MVGRLHRGTSTLDAVLHDAWLVVTVDVATLRTSPLAQPLLAAGAGKTIPGLGSITDACGFDPFTRLKQLLVTSPEAGERGDFGVAFTGDFTRDELVKCADKIAHANGGSPATSTRGDYTILENTSDPNHTRGAYRDGGPFLVGRGAWLDAMIDAVDGQPPPAGRAHDPADAALGRRARRTPRRRRRSWRRPCCPRRCATSSRRSSGPRRRVRGRSPSPGCSA